MSRRSSHSGQVDHCARASDARSPYAAAALGRGYALVHAGRHLRLGPIAFWVVVGALVSMALWTITTATYFAFREDVLTRLIARQAETQFGYEDRIAELRAQVDRISSRQLLDQEQYEQKLDQILRRQAMLESRASAFSGLLDPAHTGSIKPPARSAIGHNPTRSSLRPSPINDRPIPGSSPDRQSQRGGMEGALAKLHASLDRLEQRQATALNSLEESYDARARRIRGILSELGVEAGRTTNAGLTAMGGPLVPTRVA